MTNVLDLRKEMVDLSVLNDESENSPCIYFDWRSFLIHPVGYIDE